MHAPMTLTYRHIDQSDALNARARELTRRLQRFGERITQCHLTVEGRVGRQRKGGPYSVKIHLSVPGAEIHADSLHGDGTRHNDVYSALRGAFNNAKRQLQDLNQERVSSRISGAPSIRRDSSALGDRSVFREPGAGRGQSAGQARAAPL
jgi:ribosomal subunit interface protein